MAKQIAVIAADTHLDHLIWRTHPNITGDSYFGYRQVVDIAVARKLPLILAGDVTELLPDNTPDSNTVAMHIEQAARLRGAGCRVLAVRGQHDRVRQGAKDWLCVTGLAEDDRQLTHTKLADLNVALLSWQHRSNLADMLQQIRSDTQITVCHQVWKQLMGGSSPEGSIADVPGSLIISGDLHQQKLVRVKTDTGDKRAYSPGATHMRKRNEPHLHYAAILHDDLSISRVPLISRRVITYRIENTQSLEELYNKLPEMRAEMLTAKWKAMYPSEVQKPLLIVQDFSESAASYARVMDWCGDAFHVFYDSMRTEDDDLDLLQATAPDSVATLWDYVVEEVGRDEELLDFAKAVLESESPAKAITDYRTMLLTKGDKNAS
jgi:hypothetical protein